MSIPPPQEPAQQQFHPPQSGQQPHQGQQVNPYHGQPVNPHQPGQQEFDAQLWAEQVVDTKAGFLAGRFQATPDGFTASRLALWRWLIPLIWLMVCGGAGLGRGTWDATFNLSLLIVTLPLMVVAWLWAMLGRLTVSAAGISIRSFRTKQWRWEQFQQPVITGSGLRTAVRLRSSDGRFLGSLISLAWGWAPLEELARRSHAARAEANTGVQRRALEAEFPGSTSWEERHPRSSSLLWGVVIVVVPVLVVVGMVVVVQLLQR